MTGDRAQAFLRFCQERSVLKFGQFTLKSGRSSPYFFNAGAFHRGSDLNRLAAFYAAAIVDSGLAFDGLFGPAYKGIPLVASVAMELERTHGLDCPWTFNRKEAKDHGEGGALVGAPLSGRVLILDDVVTAGTAIREAIAIIRAAGAQPVGVALALDREERGPNGRSAVQELEAEAALRVVTVARFSDLVAGIDSMVAGDAGVAADVRRYRDAWGVAGA